MYLFNNKKLKKKFDDSHTLARFQIKHGRYTPISRCYRLTLVMIILITNRLFLCLRIYGYIIILIYKGKCFIFKFQYYMLLQQLYNIEGHRNAYPIFACVLNINTRFLRVPKLFFLSL